MKGVIVIGGHVQGLGIVRILGKLGLPIVVLDATSVNIARHSRYCKLFVKYPDNDLLNFLLVFGKSKKYKKYILLPTNDKHVEVLSKNKKILSEYFTVGTDSWDVVEKCYNKRLTYSIAENLNISIPKTWMPDSIDELKGENIEYPCIIKPAVMHGFYAHFKTKVFVCNNKEELFENYKLAVKFIPPEEVIIQEIIDGGSEHLYSACFLFDGDNIINSFVGCRARQHPPDFGKATTFAQIADNEELIEISTKLLKHINYHGVCEVEYKFDTLDGDYNFLEINPRTWKWHSIADKAGVNLLENYQAYLTNGNIKPQGEVKKASFRHLVTDIPTLLKYKRKGIYKKHNKYPVKYAVWEQHDLLPALFELIYLPILIWKR